MTLKNSFSERPNYLQKVYTIMKKFEMYLPLSEREINKLNELDRIKEVHLSNLVEGNSYTYEETYTLITKGVVSAKRSLNEAIEIDNLNKATLYCNSYDGELTEEFIKTCHGIITAGTLDDFRDEGNYRKVRNWVGDINTCPVNAINKEMSLLIEWYNDNKKNLDPILLAVRFKYRLVCIHPFINGNGRTSRLIMNWVLNKHGICICTIPIDLVNEYFESLNEANKIKGKFKCPSLEEFVCKCLVRKYEEYIFKLEDNFE